MTAWVRKYWFVTCFVIGLLAFVAFSTYRLHDRWYWSHSDLQYATLNGHGLYLHIANTEAEREQGLSGYPGLASNEGMLFVFDQPSRTCFWMKDMRFSLDILWFDTTGKLVYQEPNLSPGTYPQAYCPSADALYVVEVNAGTAERWDVQPGSILNLKQ